VTAIVAILADMLVPPLGKAKAKTQVICLHELRARANCIQLAISGQSTLTT